MSYMIYSSKSFEILNRILILSLRPIKNRRDREMVFGFASAPDLSGMSRTGNLANGIAVDDPTKVCA